MTEEDNDQHVLIGAKGISREQLELSDEQGQAEVSGRSFWARDPLSTLFKAQALKCNRL